MSTQNKRALSYEKEIKRLKDENESLKVRLADVMASNAALLEERNYYYHEFNSVIHSKSWVLTKPLRFSLRLTKKFIKFWTPYAIVRLYQKKKQNH